MSQNRQTVCIVLFFFWRARKRKKRVDYYYKYFIKYVSKTIFQINERLQMEKNKIYFIDYTHSQQRLNNIEIVESKEIKNISKREK